ncbi:Crp/Fnr family transcriptional regulator [Desulfovibrio ferrophilus]|uniref:Putative transcriptional regulator, Crp/Fnr family n=1 Tax=Desulfovibrio ferrophilus TaxID=241368 RepID=A0A2Z6B202_9BACT|nr:cyclic nucleotide-binding domain-containing protein [Desulfovibrio ferrophilus]BBD09483.1 putative transcriptional regulator, Crp/Fnr family [Desulfovibrio ferrophilus]
MNNIPWHDIAIFTDMPDADIDKVQKIFSTLKVERGEKIINEGDLGDEMFVLVSGRVRITKSMIIQGMTLPLQELQDTRKVLATLDGSLCPLFGEMALIDRDTRSATVETLEPSEFLVTNRDRFFALVKNEPEIGCHLLTALSRRLAATVRKNNSELVKLTTALALALTRSK